MLRSRVALATGEVEAALQFAREAVALSDVPLTRGWTLSALLEAQLSAGMLQDAGGHLSELIGLGDAMRCFAPTALALKARLRCLEGDLLGAESAAHDALAVAESISAKSRIVDSLEVIAGIVAQRQSPEEAARLFGAAEAIRQTTGYTRCVSERDNDLGMLSESLGQERLQASFDEGKTFNLAQAIAFARRGRGERKRPGTGWASLTPAEIRVAELVKDGLSNAEIGRRLLCSARTVQAHLTHIYAKLGVSSRAELAAESARQQS
jgi:DNA-binding CsgD family transcriptional regulator